MVLLKNCLAHGTWNAEIHPFCPKCWDEKSLVPLQELYDAHNKLKETQMLEEKKQRKYLPTISDLIDRLTISQLKEVLIPEHRNNYSQEIQDILHDIDIMLEEGKFKVDADFIRSVVVLGIYNRLIWENESAARRGEDKGNNLKLSHSLNGVRNRAKNRIEDKAMGRKDHKVDALSADHTAWEPSWNGVRNEKNENSHSSLVVDEKEPLCDGCKTEPHLGVPCSELTDDVFDLKDEV